MKYQKALTNLHNRAMQSSCSKTRMIRETKLLQELVDRNKELDPVENEFSNSCPVCGEELNEFDRFCSHCGQRIKGE